jgi:hypothetical protein
VPQPEREVEEREEQPAWWRVLWWTIGISSFVMLLLVAIAVLWLAFRRFARANARDARERRESIEPASSLAADLGDLLGAIGRRLRRGGRARHALQIRRLYFEMLDAAEARGVARPASATPLQFAPALDAHFASGVPSSISRAFAASRYGEIAIDADELRKLREGWRTLATGD